MRVLLLLLALGLSANLWAQNAKSFDKQFEDAVALFKAGQYPQAKSAFDVLTQPNENNAHVAEAHLFYALSAQKSGGILQAHERLSRYLDQFEKGKQRDDANYLLAHLNLELFGYDQALVHLDAIKNKELREQGETMRLHFLQRVYPLDTLRNLLAEHPTDKPMARLLADRIYAQDFDAYGRLELGYLVQNYGLDVKRYPDALPKPSVKKESYKLGVILPLELGPDLNVRRQAPYFEFYEGVKMAVEDLEKEGITLELYLYDTGKDSGSVAALTDLPELRGMDFFMGPVGTSTSEAFAPFAQQEQLLFFNPFNPKAELLAMSDYAYLMMPTPETEAVRVAEYTIARVPGESVLVIYGDDPRDTLRAHVYRQLMEKEGRTVHMLKCTRHNTGKLEGAIRNAGGKYKLGHIYVVCSDNMVDASLMGQLETQDLTCPVFVEAHWLDNALFSFEQYARRNFHFVYPDYVRRSARSNRELRERFEERLGVKPKYPYAHMGYEGTLLIGKMSKKHGNRFAAGLQAEGYQPGQALFGYDFSAGRDNSLVPILRFDEDYEFEWVNEPLTLSIPPEQGGRP